MSFEIEFFGHENIRSLHKNTIEITREKNLTTRGDCIIGVNASSGCSGIPSEIKKKIKNSNSRITLSVLVGDYVFQINGNGHKDLELTHTKDIVIRKSTFVCPRTLAIKCDKASDSMPYKMIKLLQNPLQKGTFKINVN